MGSPCTCGASYASRLVVALLLVAVTPALLWAQSTLVAGVRVSWEPQTVIQGTIFQIVVTRGDVSVTAVAGTFAGERVHFAADAAGAFAALAAAPVDAPGALDLHLDVRDDQGRTTSGVLQVPIAAGAYKMQRLTVAPEFGRPPSPTIQRRISEEAARAMAVARNSHGTPRLWEAPFVPPRDSDITSGFGHGRMFNDQVQSRHLGVDLRGAVGAPIRAPARGIAALVDTFYLGGNVIYLDHGAGLVTGYLDLSAHEVKQGDIVEAGQVIGRVGATGRVTGPHLHWIVRYGMITVDGLSLLKVR